jgi:hypothetical protein
METALVSLVSLALIIIASVTTLMSSLTSFSDVFDSWKRIENEADTKRRTDISMEPPQQYDGGMLEVYVANIGNVNLSSFQDWDVITRYQNGDVYYVEYSDSENPEENHWSVEGIYLSDNISVSEIFDTNVLNTGESVKLKINLSPEIPDGTYALLTASTHNGVTANCHVYNP